MHLSLAQAFAKAEKEELSLDMLGRKHFRSSGVLRLCLCGHGLSRSRCRVAAVGRGEYREVVRTRILCLAEPNSACFLCTFFSDICGSR